SVMPRESKMPSFGRKLADLPRWSVILPRSVTPHRCCPINKRTAIRVSSARRDPRNLSSSVTGLSDHNRPRISFNARDHESGFAINLVNQVQKLGAQNGTK